MFSQTVGIFQIMERKCDNDVVELSKSFRADSRFLYTRVQRGRVGHIFSISLLCTYLVQGKNFDCW